jgi:hypothetical protein
LLTSLTTFVGLSPMLLERSVQAQFLIPMAISLGFGVLFGTFVTLLLIPCGFMILDDIANLLGGRRGEAEVGSGNEAEVGSGNVEVGNKENAASGP